jgi:hypothetical protein
MIFYKSGYYIFFRITFPAFIAFTAYTAFLDCPVCSGQTIDGTNKGNENIYIARVKQFNEFIDRFNYKTNFNGGRIDSAFRAKFPREKMINALFDAKDPRLVPAGKDWSRDFAERKNKFISEVICKNLLIAKHSEKIIAEADSRIFANGVPDKIHIFLNQESVGNNMFKWVIVNVTGKIFNFMQDDTAYIRFIPPSSNETDFINLKRALQDTAHLQYYTSNNYGPDNLSLFFYMLNSGIAKFDYVEEVNYYIIDIPGWCIKVKEFNRSELNSGWLIYDLEANSLDYKDFIKSKLN